MPLILTRSPLVMTLMERTRLIPLSLVVIRLRLFRLRSRSLRRKRVIEEKQALQKKLAEANRRLAEYEGGGAKGLMSLISVLNVIVRRLASALSVIVRLLASALVGALTLAQVG